MRAVVIATVVVALGLGGCQSVNPYTGQKQTSDTTWGATAGALAGAVLGAATGNSGHDRVKRALIGAAAFGAAGAGVGAYMDAQHAKLRQQLTGVGVQVQKDPHTGIITLVMPGNISFPSGQSAVAASFYPVLDAVAQVLREYDKTQITVAGYTDNVGRPESNMALSQQRASSVASYLVGRGVAPGRVSAVGYGEASPIASNATAEGRAQNRRVVITINPPAQA